MKRTAPCEDFYEHEGRCYVPIVEKNARPPAWASRQTPPCEAPQVPLNDACCRQPDHEMNGGNVEGSGESREAEEGR
ncbi:hypothetical protein ACN28S_01350 [Cystobacter fuscus]